MELELPIVARQAASQQSHGINHRDVGRQVEDTKRHPSQVADTGNSIESKVVDYSDNECNQNSKEFNYAGYNCRCWRLVSGKVLCSKQQSTETSRKDRIESGDAEFFTMLNNFERLVVQIKMRQQQQQQKQQDRQV